MPRPPVARAALEAAAAARRSGATWAEAAAAGGISERCLRNHYPAEPSTGPKAAPTPRKPPRVASSTADATEPPPSLALEALEGGADDESLLAMARDELRNARRARRLATTAKEPAREAKWSERIERLISAVARLEPPPPPPPDALEALYRERDADVIARLEQHLPDRIDPKEIAA